MRTGLVALICALTACGDDGAKPDDAAIDTGAADGSIDANQMPMTLAETGLCSDPACATINPGIWSYAPRWELYADGATKRRWIQLPPGTKIDTSDMNYWKFPVGTKLWKEFTRGGTRVETRFIEKVAEDDTLNTSYYWASFVWDATASSSTFVDPANGMMNANGTDHDIPTRSQCRRCHQNTPGRILGVNALSLDFQGAAGDLDLQDLVAMDLLTNPPAAPSAGTTFFPLPGTAVDHAAYGFFHANCGGCHNPTSSIAATSPLQLRLDVTKLGSVAVIPARVTTLNVNGTVGGLLGPLVTPNNPGNSVVITRMNAMDFPTKMPEIGTETLNAEGIAAVTAWINQPP